VGGQGLHFERRRAIVAAGGFDRAAWNELAELGLTALTVPEAHDGMGQGAIDAMVAMEELGRGIVLEPLAQAFIASACCRTTRPPTCNPPGCRASPAAKPWWCWRTRSARRATAWTFARQKRLQRNQDMR
jgi:hypothetical protein